MRTGIPVGRRAIIQSSNTQTTDVAEQVDRLLAALAKRAKPTPVQDLLRAARIPREERSTIEPRLVQLEADGKVLRLKADKLALPAHMGLVLGTLVGNPAGFAFCRPLDPNQEDVYVSAAALRPAMHGDTVLVKVDRARRKGRLEGKIERIVARRDASIVGTLRKAKSGAILVPRDFRLTAPITVSAREMAGATDGDAVVVEIVKWPGKTTDAQAKIVRMLGPSTDPRVETEAVIHAYNLPVEFPPEVAAAARRIPAAVPPDAFSRRLDLRGQPLVTIDGENARDFDDAIMVEPLGASFLLTVAVADVAAYVTPGSPLDLEARARGCSVYFPDRVVPMLPEELSNGICSLKPGEDRLVKTVRMEFDARGRLLAAAFHDALIRSAARLTYTEVKRALADKDPAARQRLAPLMEMLERAETLARLLMQRRRQRGAIDFDLPEAEIVVDLRGQPTDILRADRNIAHHIVEEFMLAANEAVARELMRRRLQCLHRVHDTPNADALRTLSRFLEGFGLRLRMEEGKLAPGAIQAVLDEAASRPEAKLIQTVLLRSMAQARYSAEPTGHFGLATDAYVHFTSPIRRYPDLIVHRILDVALRSHGRIPSDLDAIASESSRRERVAMDAERDIVQLRKVQFMRDKVGQTMDGFVSAVTPFGFFVELKDVFVEGMVHLSRLDDDFYEHIEAQHLLRGRKTRRTFRVGDPITVQLVEASTERRQLDFALLPPPVPEGGLPPSKPRRTKRP